MSATPVTILQLTPEQQAVVMGQKAFLANITEQTWMAHRTYGTFQIPGRKDDEKYSLTEISPRTGSIDLGDKRKLDFPISAREIADDLSREINSDAGDASYFGVFVCAGEVPTEAELDRARHRLEEFYKKQVFIADQEWERTHNYMVITDVQRRAARGLGLEKEWSYEPKPLVDCPACGEKVKPGVAVCRACGAILDRAKALQFGLLPAEAGPAVPSLAGPTVPMSGDPTLSGRSVVPEASTTADAGLKPGPTGAKRAK